MGERLKGEERDKGLRYFVFDCQGISPGSPGHPKRKEPHPVIKSLKKGSLTGNINCPKHMMTATLIGAFKTQDELIECIRNYYQTYGKD